MNHVPEHGRNLREVSPHSWVRYGVALAAVALVLLIRLRLADHLAIGAPFLLYIGAVVLAAWSGGWGPGALATVLTVVMIDRFEPLVSGVRERLSLDAIFLVEGLVISAFGALRGRAERNAHVRAMQQATVARLGRLALEKTALEDLIERCEKSVREVLEARFARVVPEETERDTAAADTLDVRTPLNRLQVPIHGAGSAYAALVVEFDRARRVTEGDWDFLRAVAHVIAASARRRNAEAHAERIRSHDALLGEIGALLGEPLDYERRVAELARILVPHLGEWCAVDLLEESGEIRRVAMAHDHDTDPDLASRLSTARAVEKQPMHPAHAALETGRSQLMRDIGASEMARLAVDAEHAADLLRAGVRSVLCVPLRARGRTLGVVTLGATTRRAAYEPDDVRLAEEVVSRAALAIDNSRLFERLVAGDRAKDEFLAMLGHELRNPLAPMTHSLETLRIAGADTETRERARRVLDRQVTHMAHLVRDLLDVARINRGTIELRRESVSLATAVANAVETSQAILRAHRHRLAVALPSDPVWLDADSTRLEQILTNLINNAVEYSGPGSSTELTARRENGEVEIRIRDHGVGIPPGLLPDIFELFTRGERWQGRGPGMGIGLYLVKRLVDLHGGTIRATSEGPERGSEFTLRLPISVLPMASPTTEPEPNVNRMRTLVVDDHMDSASALAELLTAWGHDARAITDGANAADLALQLRPDLILLDLAMPGRDGYEIARELRRRPETRHAVLVALSGFADPQARARTRDAGFDHHFSKPIQVSALRELLATVATKRDQRDANTANGVS